MIYEPFRQTGEEPVSLGGLSGGVGLNAWSIDQTVNVEQTPTLSYGDLQNAGGQAEMRNGNGVDAWVTTTSVPGDDNLLDDGATLWFSFLTNNTAGVNTAFVFSLGTDRSTFFGGMEDGGEGIGVNIGGGEIPRAATWTPGRSTGSSSGRIANDTTALVVGRIAWGADAASPDTVEIFLPGVDFALPVRVQPPSNPGRQGSFSRSLKKRFPSSQ